MPLRDALATARRYHRAWSTRDFAQLDRCVADPLCVETPINHYTGRSEFLEAVRVTAQITSQVTLLAELGDGNEAMLLYDMVLPFGELRVAEHFRVEDGKIWAIRQIHDTAALRGAGFEKPR